MAARRGTGAETNKHRACAYPEPIKNQRDLIHGRETLFLSGELLRVGVTVKGEICHKSHNLWFFSKWKSRYSLGSDAFFFLFSIFLSFLGLIYPPSPGAGFPVTSHSGWFLIPKPSIPWVSL